MVIETDARDFGRREGGREGGERDSCAERLGRPFAENASREFLDHIQPRFFQISS